ncbi:unnamed protein product, partial [Rotaria sp. Silwood2]
WKNTRRCGPQCPASIHLLYHADSDKVTIYETEAEHEHDSSTIRGIDTYVKKYVEDLFNDGVKKPKLILRALQSRKTNVPTLVQLNNYLVYYKKKKFGSHKTSLDELEQWCANHQNIATDKNESFVVSYKILYDDEEYEDDDDNKFCIFI